ncbi:tpd52 like 2a isoform X4 [Denticeps clupeoides]|uniref:tpd52 like 2a isoform X4 n=1 Tax=Denticeps clupeoides TaxID=299321 RepID=UPI0010A568EC|nr:tumor protein D53 homolog isoform X4 [Denticeps clupeoides]
MEPSNHGEGFGMNSGMEGASGGALPPSLTEEEAEELRVELTKVEDEIQTLRQVLSAKERHAADIKRQLGISPLSEIKQNITKGWQDVQSSNVYKKTQETLSQAGQMTSAALSSMGSAISQRFGEMRALPYRNTPSLRYSMPHSLSMPAMRSSSSFKNLEDKIVNMGKK